MTRKRPERPRQRRYDPLAVLSYIATYQQTHSGSSPSQRRIQADLGISVPSMVHLIMQRLERAGLLTVRRYGRGHPVALALTEAGQAALRRWQAEQSRGEQ